MRRGADDPAGGVDPVELRHVQVENDHVRGQRLGKVDRLQSGGRLPDDGEIRCGAEQPGQSVPVDRMVVGQQDPCIGSSVTESAPIGSLARTAVPPAGRRSKVHSPPSSAARSRMAVTPTPARKSAGSPLPSSSISMVN